MAISGSAHARRLANVVRLGCAGALALAGALAPRTAHARQEDANPPTQVLFIAERGTLGDVLTSPKDAALRGALGMIPARLRELRASVPELEQIPGEILDVLERAASHPARFAVTNKGFDPQTGMPGIGLVVSINLGEAGEPEAVKMHREIESLRATSGMPFEPTPSKRFPGMSDLPLPLGVLAFGPRKANDGWRYELIFAAIDDPDAPFAALPTAPEGMKAAVRGTIDFAACTPLIQMFAGFAAMASPQGQQVIEQFRRSGYLGSEAIAIDYVMGQTPDGFHARTTMRRIGKHAEATVPMRDPITPEMLAVVPADASFVSIARQDVSLRWRSMRKQIEMQTGGDFENVWTRVVEMIGFDPDKDLIEALGGTFISYFADSTGGGSILSGVLLADLKDPEKVHRALKKGAERANRAIIDQIDGPFAIEIASGARSGMNYLQVRAPGLPVPIEPTLCVSGNWLVIGMTPQAAFSGARHVETAKPGGGLESSKAFAESRWNLPGGVGPSALLFVDSARTMRDGFTAATFGASALTNFVRSLPGQQPIRDPGLILPAYADLVSGARPLRMVGYWAGDDFVHEWRGDESIVASLTAAVGVGDAAPLLVGMAIGAAISQAAAEQMGEVEWLPDSNEEWEQMEEGDEEAEAPPANPPATPRRTPY